jgi:hypothetical protein
MKKKAYIHSLHSQVPETVASLEEDFDLILSMDSHLDISLGLDGEVLPQALRLVAARTSAHTALRRLTGELPLFLQQEGDAGGERDADFILAIPEGMFAEHAYAQEEITREAGGTFGDENPLEFYARFIKEYFGADIYLSPPNGLNRLVMPVSQAANCLLDIDYDYIYEAQGECYTPIREIGPGSLQSLARVIRFIEKTTPPVITLSEAKLAAIRDAGSRFSSLVDRLRTLGYEVEVAGLVQSDEETLRQIKDTEDYFNRYGRRILMNHAQDSDFEAMIDEARVAARGFFGSRGYVDPVKNSS